MIRWLRLWMVLGGVLKTSCAKKRNTSVNWPTTSIMQWCVTNKQSNQKSFVRWLNRKIHVRSLKNRCSTRTLSERLKRFREGRRKKQALGPKKAANYMKRLNKGGLKLNNTPRMTLSGWLKRELIGMNSWIDLRRISIRIWSARQFKHFMTSKENARRLITKGNRISKMHGLSRLLLMIRSAQSITYLTELY